MLTLVLMLTASGPGAVSIAAAGESGAREAPRAGAPADAPDRGKQAEQDADAGDQQEATPRGWPRQREESDSAPRPDQGCPFRGRKLDLIV